MASRGIEATLVATLKELGRVFGADRVADAAGQVLKTASQTRAVVDDNVAAVLGLAGIPSRAEVEALRRQLDAMQATLANLSRKLDRLSREQAEHAGQAGQAGHAAHHSPSVRLRRAKGRGGEPGS